MHLEPNAKRPEQNHQVYLDRRVALTGTYDPVRGRTSYAVPYVPDKSTFRLIRGKTHPTRPGSLMDPAQYVWEGDETVLVLGQETGQEIGRASCRASVGNDV